MVVISSLLDLPSVGGEQGVVFYFFFLSLNINSLMKCEMPLLVTSIALESPLPEESKSSQGQASLHMSREEGK